MKTQTLKKFGSVDCKQNDNFELKDAAEARLRSNIRGDSEIEPTSQKKGEGRIKSDARELQNMAKHARPVDEQFLLDYESPEQDPTASFEHVRRALGSHLNKTDFKFMESDWLTAEQKVSFFGTKAAESNEKTSVFCEPLVALASEPSLSQQKSEPDFKMNLFYIDSDNQRQSRQVTNPDLRKELVAKESIPNPYSVEDKRRFFEMHRERERLNYVANYEAIMMQKKNEKDFEKKTHITKMKSSHGQISLKRSFGISYIKKLACFQKNVEHIYRPIPRLVIQDSKHCQIQHSLLEGFSRTIDADFFSNATRVNLGFLMKSPHETGFRKYLEEPALQSREPFFQQHFFFENLQNLQHCFEHEFFVCIYLKCEFLGLARGQSEEADVVRGIRSHNLGTPKAFDRSRRDQLIRRILKDNKLKLTFYSKKSLNSKKCFLKSVPYKLPVAIQKVFFQKKRRSKKSTKGEAAKTSEDISLFTPEIVQHGLQNLDWKASNGQDDNLNEYVRGITDMKIGNFNTMSIKMEAFVEEAFWKGLSRWEQNVVFTYVYVFKLKVEEFLFYQGMQWFDFRRRCGLVRADIETLTQFSDKRADLEKAVESRKKNGREEALIERVLRVAEKESLIGPTSESLGNQDDRTRIKSLGVKQTDKALKTLEQRIDTFNHQQISELNREMRCLRGLAPAANQMIVEKFTKKLNSLKPLVPNYLVNTRDCFMFDLEKRSRVIDYNGRKVTQNKYYFREGDTPSNFRNFEKLWPDRDTGVATYEDYFTEHELQEIESYVDHLEDQYYRGAFLANTGQSSLGAKNIKRTKFFFGARYIWHAQQLIDSHSNVAGGVRVDTSEIPLWMRQKVLNPMVGDGLIPGDFINSIALNIYHDGEEGLAQHFDDAVRFKQPIFTLRVFSDARLSFGSQLYSFCNGAFSIDLPRGAMCVMLEKGYAANGIKHCIRPVDMTGKSGAFILRQMHKEAVKVAKKYDWLVDFPLAFQTLSLDPGAVAYWRQQKVLEKRGGSVAKKRGPKKRVKTQTGESSQSKEKKKPQRKLVKMANVLHQLAEEKPPEEQSRAEEEEEEEEKRAEESQMDGAGRGGQSEPKDESGSRESEQIEQRLRSIEQKAFKQMRQQKYSLEDQLEIDFPTFMDSCEKDLMRNMKRNADLSFESESVLKQKMIKQNLRNLKLIEKEICKRRQKLQHHRLYLNELYAQEMELQQHKNQKQSYLLAKSKYENDKIAHFYYKQFERLGREKYHSQSPNA